MGGNGHRGTNALFTYPRSAFRLVFVVADVQDYEPTFERIAGRMALHECRILIAAYANDVMQYPNSIIVYTGFALCIAGPYIDPVMQKEDEELERERKEKKKRD